MAELNRKVTLPCDIQSVWEIVTSLDTYIWRSDVKKIEIVNDFEFIEYIGDDKKTKYTIICAEPYQKWEVTMENDKIKGRWIGTFAEYKKETHLEIIQEMIAKKLYLKPFIKIYLKRQLDIYIADLKNALNV